MGHAKSKQHAPIVADNAMVYKILHQTIIIGIEGRTVLSLGEELGKSKGEKGKKVNRSLAVLLPIRVCHLGYMN